MLFLWRGFILLIFEGHDVERTGNPTRIWRATVKGLAREPGVLFKQFQLVVFLRFLSCRLFAWAFAVLTFHSVLRLLRSSFFKRFRSVHLFKFRCCPAWRCFNPFFLRLRVRWSFLPVLNFCSPFR